MVEKERLLSQACCRGKRTMAAEVFGWVYCMCGACTHLLKLPHKGPGEIGMMREEAFCSVSCGKCCVNSCILCDEGAAINLAVLRQLFSRVLHHEI